MNKHDLDVIKYLYENEYSNQREIANKLDYSIGLINKKIKFLQEKGYLSTNYKLSDKALDIVNKGKTKRAVILAAGFGMRMIPINKETPKALLHVNGETLIERIIRQLHEVGIKEIYVVIGFMKESFEYLIDEYNVKLIVNYEYAEKNNLHSLSLAKNFLENAYVIPSDLYFVNNPFSTHEFYSWYMLGKETSEKGDALVNRKDEIIIGNSGNKMIGLAYFNKGDSENLKNKLAINDQDHRYNNRYWEETLILKNKLCINAKLIEDTDVYEINTYEDLRDLDKNSKNLKSEIIDIVSDALNVSNSEITNIKMLKKGMTNRSFLFTCNKQKYIMRIPGDGTDQLINRKEEAEVYSQIKDCNICDDIIYINPNNGYKITKYLSDSRCCDANNQDDLVKCMAFLKKFHNLKLKVNHEFDIFKKLEFYESLWNGEESVYRDYKETKANVYKLKAYVDKNAGEYGLTHIDAVADNFLFYKDKNGKEQIRLIDWEYAAMQDQHIDIAMFCIYALYDRNQIDNLIDIYFENNCDLKTRIKIYCYISICGLLWSNWCEYKLRLGVEFKDYSIKQYRYAKEYYRLATSMMEELKNA